MLCIFQLYLSYNLICMEAHFRQEKKKRNVSNDKNENNHVSQYYEILRHSISHLYVNCQSFNLL